MIENDMTAPGLQPEVERGIGSEADALPSSGADSGIPHRHRVVQALSYNACFKRNNDLRKTCANSKAQAISALLNSRKATKRRCNVC